MCVSGISVLFKNSSAMGENPTLVSLGLAATAFELTVVWRVERESVVQALLDVSGKNLLCQRVGPVGRLETSVYQG